jgi:hypothetical protein
MLAEASVLHARHGADRRAILRWAAWSHLRAGRRRPALRAYAGAVLAGDLASLARAAVALVHPQPTTVRRPSPGPSPADATWAGAARQWLEESVEPQRPHTAPGAHG